MAKDSNLSVSQLVRKANRWRDGYNPIRGLVMSRVATLLEAGERGEFADLQWTYRSVEKRYPVLRSLVARRQAALSKLEWAIKPVDVAKWMERTGGKGGDGAALSEDAVTEMAEAQAEFLRQRYEQIGNMRDAIKALALAEFRGYAMLSKLTEDQQPAGVGQVKEFHWLPQWCIVRDGVFGVWHWNPEARSAGCLGLTPIDMSQVICRTVEAPIDEVGLIAFVRAALSAKDWDGFVEIVGIPGAVVTMPPSVPPGKEADYEAAAEAVAEGGTGVIPNGATATFPTATVRGSSPFKEHLEWQEKDVVLAGTGGKLTMLNEATGIGGSQGTVHQDAFDEIATMEAAEISEVFQKQFDKVELAAQFAGQPVLAYFELQPVDRSAQERVTFKREVFKGFMADGTVADVLANQTDLKQLTRDVELPVNEEYIDPYLPVETQTGAKVTGETVKDSEGDVVGGVAEGGGSYQSPVISDQLSVGSEQLPVIRDQSSVTRGQGKQLPGSGGMKPVAGDLEDEGLANRAGMIADRGARLVGAGNLTQGRKDAGTQRGGREDGDDLVNRAAEGAAMTDLEAEAGRAFAGAQARALAPVRARLAGIMAMPAADQAEAMRALRADLPDMLREMNAAPETAKVLEDALAAAVVNGLEMVKKL